jgi:hypothetical protein
LPGFVLPHYKHHAAKRETQFHDAGTHDLLPPPVRKTTMDSAEAVDYTRRNKKPRPLSELEKDKLDEFVDAIHYSSRYVFYLR